MAQTVIDPVCGMNVDPADAAGSSTYEGLAYYFCSQHCLTQFERSPEQYAVQPAAKSSCCSAAHSCS